MTWFVSERPQEPVMMMDDSARTRAADPRQADDQPGVDSPPLVVDIDGTLIHTDMLHESCLRVLHPLLRQALFAPQIRRRRIDLVPSK